MLKFENNEKVKINAILEIDEPEIKIDDVFNYVYCAKNYYKWFNMKPFVWMKFDKDFLDVGCTGRVYFTIPPFSYELTVVDVKINEYIKLESKNKLFGGSAFMKFYTKNGKIYYEDPHILYSHNKIIHKYYCLLLAGKHKPYMNNRFKVFKKKLLNEKRKNK